MSSEPRRILLRPSSNSSTVKSFKSLLFHPSPTGGPLRTLGLSPRVDSYSRILTVPKRTVRASLFVAGVIFWFSMQWRWRFSSLVPCTIEASPAREEQALVLSWLRGGMFLLSLSENFLLIAGCLFVSLISSLAAVSKCHLTWLWNWNANSILSAFVILFTHSTQCTHRPSKAKVWKKMTHHWWIPFCFWQDWYVTPYVYIEK